MDFCLRKVKELRAQCKDSRVMLRSVAAGAIGGLFPIPGTTTIIVTLLCQVLTVCAPVALFVNYIATPAEVLMIVPFSILGSRLLGTEAPSFTAEGVFATYRETGFASLLREYSRALGLSVAGWAVFSVALYGLVVLVLLATKPPPQDAAEPVQATTCGKR